MTNVPGTISQRRLAEEPTTRSHTQPDAMKLFIENAPDWQLLMPEEQDLCSKLRLQPKAYLCVKEAIFREAMKTEGKLKKKDVREITAGIDSVKGGRIFEFFCSMGWIDNAAKFLPLPTPSTNTMDDIAAALADLGLERRELISTTEGDRSGGPVANRSERLHQMKMQDIEGRRETNKRVSHWNDASLFSRDTVTEQLDGINGGQSHRVALADMVQQRYNNSSHYEQFHTRISEERAIYIRERDSSISNDHGNNYTHQPSADRRVSSHGALLQPGASVTSYSARNVTPTSVPGGPVKTLEDVRHEREENNRKREQAAARRAPQGWGQFAANSKAGLKPTKATATLSVPATPPATPSPLKPENQPPHKLPSGNKKPQAPLIDANKDRMYRMMALDYAANPGPKTTKYLKDYPERMPYFEKAKTILRSEAMALAELPADDERVKDYYTLHKDRLWLREAAICAKNFAANPGEESDEYYKTRPIEKSFLAAAIEQRSKMEGEIKGADTEGTADVAKDAVHAISEGVAKVQEDLEDQSSVKEDIKEQTTQPERVAGVGTRGDLGGITATTTIDIATSPNDANEKRGSVSTTVTANGSKRGTMTVEVENAPPGVFGTLKKYIIDFPATMSIKIVPHEPSVSPDILIQRIEMMALSMQKASTGLEGVSLSADGIFEED